MNETYLKHHGIKGQKWGDRNGPPYPLDETQVSASEKKKGFKESKWADGGKRALRNERRQAIKAIKKSKDKELSRSLWKKDNRDKRWREYEFKLAEAKGIGKSDAQKLRMHAKTYDRLRELNMGYQKSAYFRTLTEKKGKQYAESVVQDYIKMYKESRVTLAAIVGGSAVYLGAMYVKNRYLK